jgi:hypothetical protein
MLLLLYGICCVLILPVFAVGMAALQDKLLMLLRRSLGCHSAGGWGGRWLLWYSPGAASTSWSDWCLFEAKVLDPETPSCELAEGKGRDEFYLLVLSFDEGEACMGQASGNRCWWRTCQIFVEGERVMHMLLDTGGLGKPWGSMPRPFTPWHLGEVNYEDRDAPSTHRQGMAG